MSSDWPKSIAASTIAAADFVEIAVARSKPKNLSANNKSLSPADQGSGKLQQSGVTGFGLFEADQEFTVSVEP
jgi:hypothetical protein